MKVKEWTEWVDSRARDYVDLNYSVIALNEEAGEVAGWYKKAVLRKNEAKLTDEDLAHELGDVLFYLTKICILKGWSLKQIMDMNKAKLLKRFGK